MTLRIGIAGITGKVGKPLAAAVVGADDLTLAWGVSRGRAGQAMSALGVESAAPIHGSVRGALETPCDILVDYTSAAAVRAHALAAIDRRVHVVVGSSGLTDADYAELDRRARDASVGIFAAGNFALTAVLVQRFAELAARVLPTWEIVEFGPPSKPDAPSGTARELASRLASVRTPVVGRPVEDTIGEPAARGASLAGMQIHSVRVPGYLSSIEVTFGQAGERLLLRHDSIDPGAPYVSGTLLAIRRVAGWTGVRRGLDTLLDL